MAKQNRPGRKPIDGEPWVTAAVRLPRSTFPKIDATRRELRKRLVGVSVTRSDAIRMLLIHQLRQEGILVDGEYDEIHYLMGRILSSLSK